MARADGVIESAVVTRAVWARDLFETGRVQRYAKGYSVILIGFCQIPGWNDEQLIRIWRNRRVNLRTPDHNASGPPVHNADIVIRMILFDRSTAAVAFDIGLRDSHSQIIFPAMLIERAHAGKVFGPELFVHLLRNQMQREEAIGADFLNQDNQCASAARRGLDQFAAFEKILGNSGDLEVSAIFIARSGIPIDGQIAVLWLMGHCIVDCRMVHGDADDRVLRHIFYTMAAEVHDTSITQTFLVLLDCS